MHGHRCTPVSSNLPCRRWGDGTLTSVDGDSAWLMSFWEIKRWRFHASLERLPATARAPVGTVIGAISNGPSILTLKVQGPLSRWKAPRPGAGLVPISGLSWSTNVPHPGSEQPAVSLPSHPTAPLAFKFPSLARTDKNPPSLSAITRQGSSLLVLRAAESTHRISSPYASPNSANPEFQMSYNNSNDDSYGNRDGGYGSSGNRDNSFNDGSYGSRGDNTYGNTGGFGSDGNRGGGDNYNSSSNDFGSGRNTGRSGGG
ncbi:hypothetical protein K488DRAFT_74369, partial [Vararia minispora EC-137]